MKKQRIANIPMDVIPEEFRNDKTNAEILSEVNQLLRMSKLDTIGGDCSIDRLEKFKRQIVGQKKYFANYLRTHTKNYSHAKKYLKDCPKHYCICEGGNPDRFGMKKRKRIKDAQATVSSFEKAERNLPLCELARMGVIILIHRKENA